MWCWPGQSTPDQGVPVCRRRGRDRVMQPVVAGGIYLPFPALLFTFVDHGFHSAKRSVWRPAPPCLGPFRGFCFRFSSFWVWGYVTGEKSEQKKG
jgi:hypothetical protein